MSLQSHLSKHEQGNLDVLLTNCRYILLIVAGAVTVIGACMLKVRFQRLGQTQSRGGLTLFDLYRGRNCS